MATPDEPDLDELPETADDTHEPKPKTERDARRGRKIAKDAVETDPGAHVEDTDDDDGS